MPKTPPRYAAEEIFLRNPLQTRHLEAKRGKRRNLAEPLVRRQVRFFRHPREGGLSFYTSLH